MAGGSRSSVLEERFPQRSSLHSCRPRSLRSARWSHSTCQRPCWNTSMSPSQGVGPPASLRTACGWEPAGEETWWPGCSPCPPLPSPSCRGRWGLAQAVAESRGAWNCPHSCETPLAAAALHPVKPPDPAVWLQSPSRWTGLERASRSPQGLALPALARARGCSAGSRELPASFPHHTACRKHKGGTEGSVLDPNAFLPGARWVSGCWLPSFSRL